MKKIYPLLILAMLANSITAFAQKYVTVNGAGLQDGSSWANAYSGQQLPGIVSSWPGTPMDLWVAAGTYYPHPTSRDSSFRLTSQVKMYGGFAGNETMLSQRNWNTNVTILSGDIGVANNTADNSFNVVRFENVSMCGVDGFTIQYGNANDVVNPWKINGGAIFNMSAGTNFSFSDPEVRNCKIVNNIASGSGGAIANVGLTGTALMTLIDCYLGNNTANRYGGAIYSIGWPTSSPLSDPGNSQLILYNCDFVGNTVTSQSSNSAGGAVCILNGGGYNNGSFTRCDFEDNFSSTSGGAVAYSGYSQLTPNVATSTITFDSCSFLHNGVESTAGMAISSVSTEELKADMTIKNSTFENNYSMLPSGSTVIWFSNSGSNTTRNKFTSCKFLNNYRGSTGNVIFSNSGPNTDGSVAGRDSLWVSNSFFYNNTMGDDIWVNGTDNTKHVTIVSNTTMYHDSTTTGSAANIRNNATAYNGVPLPNTESSLYVYNSILWHRVPFWGNIWQLEIMNEAVGNIPATTAHSYVSNSVLFNCLPWPTDYGVNGGGNNEDYPGFEDTANMDFHLVCNAFGVDHGNNALLIPAGITTDVEGDVRIYNTTIDIGAFETQVPGLNVVPTVTVSGMTITYNHNYNGLTDSVHWEFGDGDTSIIDNGMHTYTQPGTYQVCVYVENSCGSDTACTTITIAQPQNINGIGEKEHISLYPNPVSDILSINNARNAESIIIYNAIGQQLYKASGNGNDKQSLNLSWLPAGTYILELKGKDGKTLHERFIKQ